jgi:HEAT repeat protein
MLNKFHENQIPEYLKDVFNAFKTVNKLKTLEPLIKYLSDENDEIREYAAKSFWELKDNRRLKDDTRTVDALIQSLNDQSEVVRRNIACLLGKIDTQTTLESLIQNLKNKNPDIRKNVVWGLGNSKNKLTTEIIFKTLVDENASVRLSAANSLLFSRRLYDKENIDFLIEALTNEDASVRKYASMGLIRVSDKKAIKSLIHALDDEDIRVRKNAAQALGNIGEEVIEPLVKMLENKDNFSKKRQLRAVVEALGFVGNSKTVDPLIRALSIKDVYVRKVSALALGKFNDTKAIESLKNCLNDENKQVKEAANQSLNMIKRNKKIIGRMENME